MYQVSNVSVYFCLLICLIDFSMLWCEQLSKLRWNGMELLVQTNDKSGPLSLQLLLCEENSYILQTK